MGDDRLTMTEVNAYFASQGVPMRVVADPKPLALCTKCGTPVEHLCRVRYEGLDDRSVLFDCAVHGNAPCDDPQPMRVRNSADEVEAMNRHAATGPWHRAPESMAEGDPPHRRLSSDSRIQLDAIYADREQTVPVAVNDFDGCWAVVLSEPTAREPMFAADRLKAAVDQLLRVGWDHTNYEGCLDGFPRPGDVIPDGVDCPACQAIKRLIRVAAQKET